MSLNLLIPSSSICQGNSGIPDFLSMGHCFFHASRNHPSSKWHHFLGFLPRCKSCISGECSPINKLSLIWSRFQFSWSSTLRIQPPCTTLPSSQTCQPSLQLLGGRIPFFPYQALHVPWYLDCDFTLFMGLMDGRKGRDRSWVGHMLSWKGATALISSRREVLASTSKG